MKPTRKKRRVVARRMHGNKCVITWAYTGMTKLRRNLIRMITDRKFTFLVTGRQEAKKAYGHARQLGITITTATLSTDARVIIARVR